MLPSQKVEFHGIMRAEDAHIGAIERQPAQAGWLLRRALRSMPHHLSLDPDDAVGYLAGYVIAALWQKVGQSVGPAANY